MKFAHLIIDVQKGESIGFDHRKDWKTFCRRICTLRRQLSFRKVPSIHVALIEGHSNHKSTCGRLSDINPILLKNHDIDLTNHPDASYDIPVGLNHLVATKKSYSAFTYPLLRHLKKQNINVVLLSGVWEGDPLIHMNCCVTATAIDYAKHGFRTIIIKDATNIETNEDFVGTKKRQSSNRHFGIELMPSQQVLDFTRKQHTISQQSPIHSFG